MATLRDYRRVIGLAQVLFLAGKWLKRKGIRYTSVATVLAGGTIAADMTLGAVNVSKLNVALIPGLIALFTFGVGNALVGISNLFAAEKLLVADANAMNLMEDRKKFQMTRHLKVLWDRAFKYEAALYANGASHEAMDIGANRRQLELLVKGWPAEMRRYFGIDDGNLDEFLGYIQQFRPLSESMETTEEGFIHSAGYALRESLPQKVEQALTGFDLSLLEDWYDGAFLTANDNVLRKQFAAHRIVRGIRREVGIPWTVRFQEALAGHPDPLWYTLTMKKIGACVGGLVGRLNDRYGGKAMPEYFDAQDFLWKHDHNDRLVLDAFAHRGEQALSELRTERRRLFRSIFGEDKSKAHLHVYRMFGRDFMDSMHLRLDYDIEFAAGLLDNNPLCDVEQLESLIPVSVFPRLVAQTRMTDARRCVAAADRFMEDCLPAAARDAISKRVIRTVFYLDKHGIRRAGDVCPQRAVEIARRYLDRHERYSHRICTLRQHYELTRLQLLSYIEMIDELAEYD
jgi:hypothetical protein